MYIQKLFTFSSSNFMTTVPIIIVTFSLELTKRWHLSALLFMRLLSNQVIKDLEASPLTKLLKDIYIIGSSIWRIVICIVCSNYAV